MNTCRPTTTAISEESDENASEDRDLNCTIHHIIFSCFFSLCYSFLLDFTPIHDPNDDTVFVFKI